jgi:hypothetical protein
VAALAGGVVFHEASGLDGDTARPLQEKAMKKSDPH